MLTNQDFQLITASLNFALKNEPDALAASQAYVSTVQRLQELHKQQVEQQEPPKDAV